MEKCPFCHEEGFICGTEKNSFGHYVQTKECLFSQVLQLTTRIAGMEAELSDYGDTVTKLRADLARCRERLAAWHHYHKVSRNDCIVTTAIELAHAKLRSLGEL